MSTKAQRKKRHNGNFEEHNHLNLIDIIPLTTNQKLAFQAFNNGKNLLLHGAPGTGKSLISLYLAIKEVDRGNYDKIIIFRSTVPSREMGFLKGSVQEKISVYEAPYHGIFQKLYGRADAYGLLKQKKLIQFESTAFTRGITIENAIVLFDETQNAAANEIHAVLTRMGENSRLILSGDIRQCDLNTRKETSGLTDVFKIIKNMTSFATIEFGVDDILRSGFVKEYIKTRMKLEDQGIISPLF